MMVKITKDAYMKLMKTAFSCYENGFYEKCGFAIVKDDVITDVIEATEESSPGYCTLDHSKLSEFKDKLGEENRICCWWHVHDGFCTPSQTDVNTQQIWEAFDCDYSILVDARHAEVRVWGLDDGEAVHHEFEIAPFTNNSNLKLDEIFVKQNDYIDLQLMRAKKVAVFGVGQLGSNSSLYLAKSGIGSLILLDKDTVELRNTNVQLLYSPEDVGSKKSQVIADKIRTLAPWTEVIQATLEIPTGYENPEEFEEKFNEVCELVKGADIALCCFDNIESRVTVAKICKKLNMPMIDAGVLGKSGQVLATVWGKTPCIACLNLSGAGSKPCLLASTVCSGAIVSSLQVAMAIDYLHGKEMPNFVTVDLENFNVSPIPMKRKSDCWLCGDD